MVTLKNFAFILLYFRQEPYLVFRYDYEHNRKKIIEWLYSSPSIKRHISILADKAPRKLIDEIVEVGVTVAAYFKEIFLAIQDRLRET